MNLLFIKFAIFTAMFKNAVKFNQDPEAGDVYETQTPDGTNPGE